MPIHPISSRARLCFLVSVAIGLPSVSSADIVMTVDPTRSYLELQAISWNQPPFNDSDVAISEVFPGSMRSSLSGGFYLLWDGGTLSSAASIQFSSFYPYPYLSIVADGVPGATTPSGDPAQFSFFRESFLQSPAPAAIDDLRFVVDSAVGLDVIDGTSNRYFDARSIVYANNSAYYIATIHTVDYTDPIDGLIYSDHLGSNFAIESGILRIDEQLVEVEIPIELYIQSQDALSSFEAYKLSGVVVATAVVPEAGSFALATIGACIFFGAVVRQWTRQRKPDGAASSLLG